MKNRLLLVVALVASLAVLGALFVDRIAGVVPGRSGPRRVYFADNISNAHQAVIDRFNDRHRGEIEVVPVDLPFTKFTTNERKELLARSLRTRSDLIDVFAVDLIWVPRFSKWGEPLDGYFGPEDLHALSPQALASCIYESTLIAMPMYIDVGMLYYRRDIIGRLPDADSVEARLRRSVTWDEMLHLRDRLGYRGRPFYVFQGKPYEGLICNFAEHLAGEDPAAFSKNSMPLGGEAALHALQRMVGFLEPGGISPAAVTGFDEIQSYRYMLDSNAVFVRGWPNFPESFRSTYADTAKLATLGWAALPHVEGHRPVAVFGGWDLMIAKSSENRDAASEFIRFVQSIESQKIMYEMGGYIPVNEAVYADSAYLRIHPDLAFKRALLDFGFHRPALEGYTRISDLVSHAIHRALKKELAPRDALRLAAEDIASDPGARR